MLSATSNFEVDLNQSDSHHARDVLRLKPGTEVTLVCRGTGEQFLAQISELAPQVRLRLISQIAKVDKENPVKVLCFGLCKGDKNEIVCQKATELGVAHIVFWQADNSIVKLKAGEHSRKLARFEKIAEEACKQSGHGLQPSIYLIENTNNLIKKLDTTELKTEHRLCCSLSPKAIDIRNISRIPQNAHLLIGPEADFSPAEEAQLSEFGVQLVSLGSARLRSETAAIVAIAMSQALWGGKLP